MTAPGSDPGGLRLLAAPCCEPPYDDEVDRDCAHIVSPGAIQGALALTFSLPSGVPTLPSPLLPVPTAGANPALRACTIDELDDDELIARQPTSRADLPDPRPCAGRLAQAIVEVVAGARPLTQLARWTNGAVYDELRRRLTELVRSGAPGVRRVATGAVRSVHVHEPLDGIAEVCAVVQAHGRARAVALRLEGLDGRWLCTSVTFV